MLELSDNIVQAFLQAIFHGHPQGLVGEIRYSSVATSQLLQIVPALQNEIIHRLRQTFKILLQPDHGGFLQALLRPISNSQQIANEYDKQKCRNPGGPPPSPGGTNNRRRFC